MTTPKKARNRIKKVEPSAGEVTSIVGGVLAVVGFVAASAFSVALSDPLIPK
jgi:hypothetical protein